MISKTNLPILSGLKEIQHVRGYLPADELARLAQRLSEPVAERLPDDEGVSLAEVQAIASFYPHFHLKPPATVRVALCRDMACHMHDGGAGAKELEGMNWPAENVSIKGVSCLGRCDRAPAACVSSMARDGGEEDRYYLGRNAEYLKQVVEALLAGTDPAEPDLDLTANQYCPAETWKIDPYRVSGSGRFSALRRVADARKKAIEQAVELKKGEGLSKDWLNRFRRAALGEPLGPKDADLVDAVREWRLGKDGEGNPNLGNWSKPFLDQLGHDTSGDWPHNLRGMGGGGAPAAKKWRDVRNAVRDSRGGWDERAYVVVNGDESEPGTFKDREILLRTPHLVVEGVIIAGLLTEATAAFIFIRHEYPEQIKAVSDAVRLAEALGFCGTSAERLGRPFPVSVVTSPGGYICGEQSALVESLSDHRAEPRNMPPLLESNGLYDRPTLVSNVETFAWVPYVLKDDSSGKAYADLGIAPFGGRRFFSVSGDVKRPGVYEVPMGLPLRKLIHDAEYCGGLVDGKKLKAIAPSGPSGGFLPAFLPVADGWKKSKAWQYLKHLPQFNPEPKVLDILDLPLELDVFRQICFSSQLGAGLVVYANDRDMCDQAVNALQFFRNESCGKCVPCRIGSQKLAVLGERVVAGQISAGQWELVKKEVEQLLDLIASTSICGLGRSVPWPMLMLIKFFPADLEKHLKLNPGPDGSAAHRAHSSETRT